MTWEYLTLYAVLHLPLPKIRGGECTYASHLLESTAYEGEGKPGFSRQKMRNEYNKDIKCINLQKTPLRQAMPIYFSKWTKTPKAPITALLHPAVIGLTGVKFVT